MRAWRRSKWLRVCEGAYVPPSGQSYKTLTGLKFPPKRVLADSFQDGTLAGGTQFGYTATIHSMYRSEAVGTPLQLRPFGLQTFTKSHKLCSCPCWCAACSTRGTQACLNWASTPRELLLPAFPARTLGPPQPSAPSSREHA